MRARFVALAAMAFTAPSSGDVAIDPGAVYDDDASLPAHADDVVDYTMTAELDPSAHTVHGDGTIVWRNTSSKPVSEVWLHLYLNAFKNEQSTFMRDPAAGGRGAGTAADWGTIDVRRFALVGPGLAEGGVDLWPNADKTGGRPGDLDETDVRVPLPHEIPPGGSATFQMTWDDKLPSIVERTGYYESFHMIAQWFPKLARLEPDGRWAHFPFHHLAEFYADFGTYDVTLKVPNGFIVGATGPVIEEHDEGNLRVQRHVQSDVHDFAWTAYDHFDQRSETIDGVAVRVLFPRGFGYVAERELKALRFAIPHFGKRYGKYPYRLLTVVHPPQGAAEAGGMEYPTLITTGGPWYGPPGVFAIELVTIHEFGHQWFYGMIASDEVTWPFLDEGLNSYAEQEGMQAWLGPGNVADLFGLKLGEPEMYSAWPGPRVHDAPVAQPAFDFPTAGHYGALVYGRTASLLATVDRVFGPELGARAIGRYARRARFRHPTPEDLLASYEEVFGPDVRAMLEEALFRKGWVDFKVESIHTPRVAPALGIFDRDGKRETVRPGAEPPSAANAEYDGFVLVSRRGTLVLPVDVELTLEDGSKQHLRWDGKGNEAPEGNTWTRLPFRGQSRVAFAVVDPDRAVLLDGDPTNNFARAGGIEPPSPARLGERLTYAAQLFFSEVLP